MAIHRDEASVSYGRYIRLLLKETWTWSKPNVAAHSIAMMIAFLAAVSRFRLTGERSSLSEFVSVALTGLAFWLVIDIFYIFFRGGFVLYRSSLGATWDARRSVGELTARLTAGPNLVMTVNNDLREIELQVTGNIAGLTHKVREGISMIVVEVENNSKMMAAEDVSGEIRFYGEGRDEPYFAVPVLWFSDTNSRFVPSTYQKPCRLAVGEKRRFITALKLLKEDEAYYLTEDAIGGMILHPHARLPVGKTIAKIRLRGTAIDATHTLSFYNPEAGESGVLQIESFEPIS